MTTINRVRVVWSGFTGAPGVTTLYFNPSTTDLSPLKTFLTAINGFLPNAVSLAIPSSGDQINDADGVISGVWVASGSGNVTGFGGSAAYSGSSGFCIDWRSATIVAGRRRQGRSYFVPASVNAYQTDGTIIESTRTTVMNAAATMIAAFGSNMLVWSRPFPGKAGVGGAPDKPARPGVAVPVVSGWVPDIAAVMRSRRN